MFAAFSGQIIHNRAHRFTPYFADGGQEFAGAELDIRAGTLAVVNLDQITPRMNQAIAALEPQALWKHFADLNAIPRPSKHEARVVEWVLEFGRSRQLETTLDEVGNVLIRKPASPGMESRATVVLQSHLDMVCQKNNDTAFDFMTEGIRMQVDGDWVKADGTTL